MNELSAKTNTQIGGLETNSGQFFEQNQKDSLSYFSERAKKMVTAVYIVTNFVPATDPLRLAVRKFSIRLLTLIGHMPASQSLGDVSAELGSLCRKIVEMLEIAFFSGYVSEMNYSVLKSEFDVFLNEIFEFKNSHGTLDRAFLQVGPVGSVALVQKLAPVHSVPVLKTENKPKNIHKSLEKRTETKGVVEAKKTSRKETIISIIRLKGKVSIKDISSAIKDCSEKTIQRELLALVSEGTLKKSGDRRWSVYMLAQ